MKLGAQFRLPAMLGLCMLALAVSAALPASAEFPPEGAVPDPNNPLTATGEFPSPKHDGATLPYVFYFDCGKRKWIGVAVTGAKPNQTSAPSAMGPAREYPPGPPTGSKLDGADPAHATNRATGEHFALRAGDWVDAKTGTAAKSPKLCSEASGVTAQPAVKNKSGTGQGEPLHADGPPPPTITPVRGPDKKPDNLPPPPSYIKK